MLWQQAAPSAVGALGSSTVLGPGGFIGGVSV